MSPVPDNIFLLDKISIIAPFLTWSTLIIATPGLCVCYTCYGQWATCVISSGFYLFSFYKHILLTHLLYFDVCELISQEWKTKQKHPYFISCSKWRKKGKKAFLVCYQKMQNLHSIFLRLIF